MATNRFTAKAEPVQQVATVQVLTVDGTPANTTYKLTIGGKQARQFITFSGQPLDTETVVVGSKTYTFQTTLTNVDGNVQIAASSSLSLTNLISAITLAGVSGTDYAAAMTLHPDAMAVRVVVTADIARVTAKQPGTAGNALATTETLTNGSWGAATMLEGLEGQVNISVPGNTDVNTTASDLQVALAASTHPYFSQITFTQATDTITLTAKTKGAPFIVSSSVSGGTGTIGDPVTSTSNSGPNDLSKTANWSQGILPVATHDVVIDFNLADVCWGLEIFETELLNSLLIILGSKRLGLNRHVFSTSADARSAVANYMEYRPWYLKTKVDQAQGKTTIRRADGSTISTASGRIMIDLQDEKSDVDILEGPSSSADTGKPAIRMLMNHTNNNVFVDYIIGGFGLAVDVEGETSLIELLTIGDNPNNFVYTGTGVTWGANSKIFQKNGTAIIHSGGTIGEIEKVNGTLICEGDYRILIFVSWAGQNNMWTLVTAAADEIVSATLNGGQTDVLKPAKDKQWTTLNLYGGALTYDPQFFKAVTTKLNETAGGVPPITTRTGT